MFKICSLTNALFSTLLFTSGAGSRARLTSEVEAADLSVQGGVVLTVCVLEAVDPGGKDVLVLVLLVGIALVVGLGPGVGLIGTGQDLEEEEIEADL